MLAFCEKVALPCFLARDANPDLYAYLGYLKTQVEAKPCEEDFETIRVMGKGGFGLVKGCKTLRTGKIPSNDFVRTSRRTRSFLP